MRCGHCGLGPCRHEASVQTAAIHIEISILTCKSLISKSLVFNLKEVARSRAERAQFHHLVATYLLWTADSSPVGGRGDEYLLQQRMNRAQCPTQPPLCGFPCDWGDTSSHVHSIGISCAPTMCLDIVQGTRVAGAGCSCDVPAKSGHVWRHKAARQM